MVDKRVRVVLDTGQEFDHTMTFQDESDFKDFVLKVATNIVELGKGKGLFILEGPYAWYWSAHIIALQFLDPVPEDGKEPIGFKST
ncbi:MAG: hypothetical protein ACE5JL_17075 [Dehalococcoidia bacterium]